MPLPLVSPTGWQSLSTLRKAESRSISPENPTGEKGKGGMSSTGEGAHGSRELGLGWKKSPCFAVEPGKTLEIANITGPGVIQQIWTTVTGKWRSSILRFYWDDQEHPSVECPVGDFFASGLNKFAQVNSLPVCVNPGSAFNCYWPMPFRKRCRITIENRELEETIKIFYQINYELADVSEQEAYFHAQFRRVNPVPYGRVYTILDGVRGQGHYVGTYMTWGVNNNGWWGEGEIKFYMDGDIPEGVTTDEAVAEHGGKCFPTICGTGTEDYFCGSYNFENKATKRYQEFSTPYAGMPQVERPDGLYDSQQRFSLYRWHLTDPVRFSKDLAVTIQALGWRSLWRFLPLQDDLSSVAFWYQTLPTAPFPQLPDAHYLEII